MLWDASGFSRERFQNELLSGADAAKMRYDPVNGVYKKPIEIQPSFRTMFKLKLNLGPQSTLGLDAFGLPLIHPASPTERPNQIDDDLIHSFSRVRNSDFDVPDQLVDTDRITTTFYSAKDTGRGETSRGASLHLLPLIVMGNSLQPPATRYRISSREPPSSYWALKLRASVVIRSGLQHLAACDRVRAPEKASSRGSYFGSGPGACSLSLRTRRPKRVSVVRMDAGVAAAAVYECAGGSVMSASCRSGSGGCEGVKKWRGMEEPPRIGAKTESVYIAGNFAPVSSSVGRSQSASARFMTVHGEFGAAFTKGAGILYPSNPEPRVICVNFGHLVILFAFWMPTTESSRTDEEVNKLVLLGFKALRSKEKERKIRGVQD
ncbi:hypothetical protein B0H13DRAFT_2264155 [Mycena leptocephala]|nr:hypothetical protein B0H13DRAFT_2264155 [Mycena leptocephala]